MTIIFARKKIVEFNNTEENFSTELLEDKNY